VAGSASGELVAALRARGIDAWGIENNRAIHARTPKALKKFNKLGSIVDMPFKDGEFDFVFETSLCHVAEKQVARTIRELNRVMKTGLLFGSVTSDMPGADRPYDLLRGVKKLGTGGNGRNCFSTTDSTCRCTATTARTRSGGDAGRHRDRDSGMRIPRACATRSLTRSRPTIEPVNSSSRQASSSFAGRVLIA